jgi:hypothetical protein
VFFGGFLSHIAEFRAQTGRTLVKKHPRKGRSDPIERRIAVQAAMATRQPRKDAPQFVLSGIVTVHEKVTPEFLRYLVFLASKHGLFLSHL